ncbi:MAG TPA: pitrilysin family protein [Vicinamibacteria bacterium]|nr:pitrilysin family protein [Vicinamibacteria bacterium]
MPHLSAWLFFLGVFLVSSLALPSSTQDVSLPEGIQRVASVEGITEYRLDNGLRLLLFPDPSKLTITVNITYLVGSKHEGYGETGMAHLLEHLVFKGTPAHPDIPQELTEHGARPNGTTWYDRTNYFETFPANDENLEWALDLEADRMVNSFIARRDLDSEMTVVRNEFEMGENYPQNVLMQRMLSTAYLWHSYGKSTIGSRADIENVPIENLQAFYRTWYQPDNSVLIVAGNFDESAALELVRRKLGTIPRPVRTLPSSYTVEPPQDGERSVTLRRVGDVQVVGAAFHVPAGSHPDFAAIDLLSFVLGDTPSGRLYKALVETQKASRASSFAFQLADPGILFALAEVRKDGSLAEARDILLREIDRVIEEPPTQEEIDRARASRLKDWDTTMRASERAAILLSNWAAMGDWRLMFLHRDRLEKVTPEDVHRVAVAYLASINRTVGLYIPTTEPLRAEVPAAPNIDALVEDYKGRETLAMGEAFDPSPEAVESRTARSEIEPGLRIALLPKKTRGSVIQIALDLRFGNADDLRGRASAGELTAPMLLRGTESKSRQEIQDELDRLRANLRLFGEASRAGVRLEVPRENLLPALDLVAEILRHPSFPSSELEVLRQETLARLEDSRSDPLQIAMTAFRRHSMDWPKEDPRYVPTLEERIERTKSVTLDEIREFHTRFYGLSHAELAAVGDFDATELESALRDLFGGWTSGSTYARLESPYRDKPPLIEELEAPDKESAVFLAGLPMEIRDEDPDYPALVLGNFMTGGGFLNSRVATRLRQKEGLSYGAGCTFDASAWEKSGRFFCYAIYAPQHAERLESSFKEEIARILDDGFSAEEIAAAKQGWLEQRRLSRAQERELAASLNALGYEGRTLEWASRLEAEVRALSASDILEAMQRHLKLDKMSFVKAGDFARVGTHPEK